MFRKIAKTHTTLKAGFNCRLLKKQGRVHGYSSSVWVGRGSDEIDQLSSRAGAVTPKLPVNAKKQSVTNRQTDRQWVVESRARD